MASASKEIAGADALKFFKGVKVQTATPVNVKGEDGKVRPGFETADAPLAEEHITGARDYGKRVVITTIDGRRHEAEKRAEKAA